MSELIEKILRPANIKTAKEKVYANKGAGGVDGVTVWELDQYMTLNWKGIRDSILNRTYKPQPVLRVEIPKESGGVRKLGIPTVIDRVIEQAIAQVLTPIFEPLFSEYSYGFRPGRRCEQAIMQLLEYFNEGFAWVVDIDLEKFFDNVPQDKLMSLVGRVIHDGDTESLIRKYLKAGVMVRGTYEKTELGTPQGGNLSPLLSNVMLNELDKELEARGLRFTRYADDCVIVLSSEASAKRVMYSITDWIQRKLGLKVNVTKTKITKPGNLKYLGFGFWKAGDEWKSRPHQDSVTRYKRKIKAHLRRNWSTTIQYRIRKINEITRGWINYYALGDMKTAMKAIESHLLRMLRILVWKQWKVRKARIRGLIKCGIHPWQAKLTAGCGNRYMMVSMLPAIKKALPKAIFLKAGLVSPIDYYDAKHSLKLG